MRKKISAVFLAVCISVLSCNVAFASMPFPPVWPDGLSISLPSFDFGDIILK
ncbi:MAG: hypothetical protein LBM93_09630 [Oscillospiraceae bacterium]|jgi:hypothetical protein|nr:hypothetical protein [Oscillospiraceae bacterium]